MLLNNSFMKIDGRSESNLSNGNLNLANVTSSGNNEDLKPIIDSLLVVFLVVIMLSVGCEITWESLLAHIKKPIGIGIGMVSQFCVMPLSAYVLIKAINISNLLATGVLIISCCPGGPLSNGFTYFCDGDLSLSVAMTSLSTLLAMGVMPLNLWLYGRSFESEDLIIPNDKLALSLVSVTSPVAVGMLLRWRYPRLAGYVTKIGGYISIIIVISCAVLEVMAFPNMFTRVPGKLYAAVICLPLIGMTLGFALATVFKQDIPVRKTIAFECGTQNVPTALAVISLSFAAEFQEDLTLLPWLYGFAMVSGSSVFCIAYQIWKCCRARREQKRKQKGKANIPLKFNITSSEA